MGAGLAEEVEGSGVATFPELVVEVVPAMVVEVGEGVVEVLEGVVEVCEVLDAMVDGIVVEVEVGEVEVGEV